MPLSSGTRLGPYEILSALGAGGMGEVYRGRDTRLGRDIAIKVLPATASSDAERRERFEREAQAIAALNHPNIVTIFAIENIEGQALIAMELIEGRSLAEVIPPAGLPVDRVLTVAIGVADALVAAHQKGITHRDLKPANIMLGDGDHAGRVKVLDFGLAKLTDASAVASPGAGGGSLLPTGHVTAEGRILGTVAYMSPEQAEGKPVDPRSDLFSLGAVLYEMATGQRPFTGESSVSILASIIRDTPPSVTDVNATLPSELGRIVRRALTKDPERRYQTAKDFRNDLEELKASLAASPQPSATASTMSAVGSVPAPSSGSTPVYQHPSSDSQMAAALVKRHRGGVAIAAAVVLVALAGGVYAIMNRRAQPAADRATAGAGALDELQITQLTTSGNAGRPAISPEGKYVAYVQEDGNDFSLWIRQTTTSSNVQIVPVEAGVTIAGATVTPDGSFVDYVRRTRGAGTWELWRVPFLGGTPKKLIDDVTSPVGWAPDGQHLAFLRVNVNNNRGSRSLMIADPDGSHERVLATRTVPARFLTLANGASVRPAWSLDGRVIAVPASDQPGGVPKAQVVIVEVATGSEKQVIPVPGGQQGLAWLDDGSLVLDEPAEAGAPVQLWRLSYPGGQLSRLTNDLSRYIGVSVTADRRALVTARADPRGSVWMGDGKGNRGTDVDGPDFTRRSTVRWAGERLLYATSVGGRTSVFSLLPGRSAPDEIAPKGISPVATSDGRTIVYVSTDASTRGLWRVDADGRHPVLLVAGDPFLPVVTPDDRQVIFLSSKVERQSPWIVSIDGGTPTHIANLFVSGTGGVDVSPDGRSIVFTSQEGLNRPTIVCQLPSCTARRTLTLPGVRARWSPDGRAIAYVDNATQSNLWMQPLDGKTPQQLTHFTDRTIDDFAWSHDGKRLAIARATTVNDIVLFKGLKR